MTAFSIVAITFLFNISIRSFVNLPTFLQTAPEYIIIFLCRCLMVYVFHTNINSTYRCTRSPTEECFRSYIKQLSTRHVANGAGLHLSKLGNRQSKRSGRRPDFMSSSDGGGVGEETREGGKLYKIMFIWIVKDKTKTSCSVCWVLFLFLCVRHNWSSHGGPDTRSTKDPHENT